MDGYRCGAALYFRFAWNAASQPVSTCNTVSVSSAHVQRLCYVRSEASNKERDIVLQ
jgi:hypothetical protein